MKLDIRQNPFSRNEQFTATDAAGRKRFRGEGEPFVGHTLGIWGDRGNQAASVRRKSRHGLTRFQVERSGATVDMRQTLALLTYRFVSDDGFWNLSVSFTGHFFILREGEAGPVHMTARRKWLAWRDRYEMELRPGADAALCLALLLGAGWRTR